MVASTLSASTRSMLLRASSRFIQIMKIYSLETLDLPRDYLQISDARILQESNHILGYFFQTHC